jgi:hypothetical protein
MFEPRSNKAILYSNAKMLFGEDAKIAVSVLSSEDNASSLAFGKELPSFKYDCNFS